ncbi:MAG TPA: carboxylating nicotinate-nucleotide diphosphorylase [Nitrospiria bacterium]|nr:carboxylating nicotinate-nucleotide diphosphorylase [Nitrospiria bacterium]
MALDPDKIKEIIRTALREDLEAGDVTTASLFPNALLARGEIISRVPCVIAGIPVVRELFKLLDPEVAVKSVQEDGATAIPGKPFLLFSGDGRSLLKGERTALNFLQRLSGIATLTRQFVKAVEGTGVKILDTRKTTPGLRVLEKYAVSAGGGTNHRFHLGDAILVKDNHIALKGGLEAALKTLQKKSPPGITIEVEAKTLDEVEAALKHGADVILLDNMNLKTLRSSVALIGKRAKTEASGGVTLETVKEIAKTGVNFISIGALTHSAPSVDLTMDIFPET